MHPITFVFDIDDTLARCRDRRFEVDNAKNFREFFELRFYFDHIIEAQDLSYLVFPGMPELWRWLEEMGHRFVISSSGPLGRNDSFADAFIKLVFKWRESVKRGNVRVLSRCHLVDTTEDRSRDDVREKYDTNCIRGKYKKVLEDCICSRRDLPYTILVDDDPSYVTGNEEPNFLGVSPGVFLDIEREPRYMFKAFFLAGVLRELFGEMESFGLAAVPALARMKERMPLRTYGSGATERRPLYDDKRFYHDGETLLRELNPKLRLPEGFDKHFD